MINSLINKLHETIYDSLQLVSNRFAIHPQNHRYAILFCMERLYIVITQYRN